MKSPNNRRKVSDGNFAAQVKGMPTWAKLLIEVAERIEKDYPKEAKWLRLMSNSPSQHIRGVLFNRRLR